MTTQTTGAAELPEALPRYREYMHLRTTGAWSDGVPAWAKDYSGLMNDMTAAHAVIEELHAQVEALGAAQAGVQWQCGQQANGFTVPRADSQPVPDERDDFEKVFPLPSGCIRVGTGYASTGYSNWAAHTHCERWQGWQARAARAPADSVTAPAGGVDDAVDAIALARYKVVPAHESMFHRFAVVAGDGKQQLYLGREVECENMARKFAGAFLDGAFYQSNIAPTTPAQAAPSVLEDAARLERERICAAIKAEDDYCVDHGDYMLDSDDCIKIVRGEWVRPDFSVDAARKQGGAT